MEKKEEFEEGKEKVKGGGISYKKLNKMILKQHPSNPDTNKKFDIWETITVHNFGYKLGDSCNCIKIYKRFKKFKKK